MKFEDLEKMMADSEVMSQEKIKDELVQLKNHFNDLNSVKMEITRQFIMKEIFSIVSKIEINGDKLYSLISKMHFETKKMLVTANSLRQLQNDWMDKSYMDEMESKQLEIDDLLEDRIANAEFFSKIGVGKNESETSNSDDVDQKMSEKEQNCYTRLLKKPSCKDDIDDSCDSEIDVGKNESETFNSDDDDDDQEMSEKEQNCYIRMLKKLGCKDDIDDSCEDDISASTKTSKAPKAAKKPKTENFDTSSSALKDNSGVSNHGANGDATANDASSENVSKKKRSSRKNASPKTTKKA